MSHNLTHRPLTSDEAELLHDELKTTPNIIGYTVRELAGFRDVLVAERDGALAGVCICKRLLFGWTEIAVIYVLPAYRGQGIARRLFDAAMTAIEGSGRHAVALSRSPEVLHLMRSAGMTVPYPVWRAPLAFHLQMFVHLQSRYRFRESMRKAREMSESGRLLLGVRRNRIVP